ncbi:hypothetical protein V6N12_005108 [Hibiscus sabdariffa]|uniref:Uncharacterized protein n=1 Tax=Hibiscus sabdariffa TaxID=183260 RepID=A0ABR2CQ86_9ROSI
MAVLFRHKPSLKICGSHRSYWKERATYAPDFPCKAVDGAWKNGYSINFEISSRKGNMFSGVSPWKKRSWIMLYLAKDLLQYPFLPCFSLETMKLICGATEDRTCSKSYNATGS